MSQFRRVMWVGLAFGFGFNLFGWIGNNFLLGPDWEAASLLTRNSVELPYPRWVREVVSLAPDFVYGLTMVWLYAQTSDRTKLGALKFVLVYWLATVVIVYLAIVNSKFLSWEISVKTSLLALALFLPAVWILPALFERREASATDST